MFKFNNLFIHKFSLNKKYILKFKSRLRNNIIMRILITGGGGYLGSILSRKLLSKGYKVRVIDQLWFGKESIDECIRHENFELIQEDIRNLVETVRAMKDVDAVIHLASVVGMPASSIEPKTSEEIGYLATKNIAELCQLHDIGTYIFASTCSVYGAQPDSMITEKSPVSPLDSYAKLKYLSERSIGWLNRAPTILRFGTLYGLSPRMRFDLVINLFIAQALQDGEITVHGGDQYRPFLHVQDAADSIIFALENNLDGVYNVISENMTILEAAERVKKLTNCKVNISKEIVDDRNYKVSGNKIKTFGFIPSRNLETAFKEIKDEIDTGKISDYTENKFNNFKLLNSSQEMREKVFIQGIGENTLS
jgi:nucleoside-diphosphate-sugar epimerase